jgi:alpha-D-xyloside xylohydrolase
MLEDGILQFTDRKGKVLLQEYDRTRSMYEGSGKFASALEIVPRTFMPKAGADGYKLIYRLEANEGEKIFGMGQYQQPYLDMKGCVVELAQRNSQASVPFLISSRGYGMLWNNPAIGKVTFGKNLTEWIAENTKQLDYWITAGDTPAEIEEAYADAAGKVPMMPEYGLGFWQCKLRYQTQEELLEVAREYKRRGIPVDVIVADFFHWPHEGDWKFDKDFWPDPAAMVKELEEMGTKLMVSIWPTVDGESENYEKMREMGYLARSEYGKRLGQIGNACFFDPTNPDARKFVWERIKENYYKDGIQIFWLDEAEPEFTGYEYEHYRYFAGADLEVGNMYPKAYAQMAYDGMEAEGQENIVNLLRCAWAGSQRYGALVWSGDIDSSFRALRNQLAAGLNMGLAGIPWWTTDIGGFHGGNIHDEGFREVLVRWFAWGCFLPVMRLHGFREPFKPALSESGGGKQISGAENEIWSYGDRVYEICRKYITLRENMRPYVRSLMKAAHEKGTPLIRPLFYDFPEDEKAWETGDEHMFGPDVLVAPVLYENVRERSVYLPEGNWRNINDGECFEGGRTITAPAPYEAIPVFVKAGSEVEKMLIP